MSEIAEILSTIERLQRELEDLTVRGLRTTGPEHLGSLRGLREEFERIGADHLAGRIRALIEKIESDDAGSAECLLYAQSSLRVFERALTLETARGTLEHLLAPEGAEEDE